VKEYKVSLPFFYTDGSPSSVLAGEMVRLRLKDGELSFQSVMPYMFEDMTPLYEKKYCEGIQANDYIP